MRSYNDWGEGMLGCLCVLGARGTGGKGCWGVYVYWGVCVCTGEYICVLGRSVCKVKVR